MAIATQAYDLNQDHTQHPPSFQKTQSQRLLNSRWSYGRAYFPIVGILLLLMLSLGLIRFHWLGVSLFRSLRRS